MEVKITTWKVATLYKLKDKINEQPIYQRGEVWKARKKSILIDSMLRGIDIPKIYLRKLGSGNAHDYEVADGQQRLKSIYSFIEKRIDLLDDYEKGLNLGRLDSKIVGGKNYDSIPSDLRDRFNNYEITIAVIEDASNAEIRTLFGLLQEGEPLVPAEKRNAIISKIGTHIDNYALNHVFFLNSRIPAQRYKRQDFMAHVLALIVFGNKYSLKAALLLQMYLDKNINLSPADLNKIAESLDLMSLIDQESNTKIYKKYHFIDIFWVLYKNHSRIDKCNYKLFAKLFDAMELRRLSFGDNPDKLIEGKNASKDDKELHGYLVSFRYNGAEPESIKTRSAVIENLFNKSTAK